jgi:hypothetical protein
VKVRRLLIVLVSVGIAVAVAGLAVRARNTPVRLVVRTNLPSASVNEGTTASAPTTTNVSTTTTKLVFPVLDGVDRVGATGGPYLSPEKASDVALGAIGCKLGVPTAHGDLCAETDTTFFARYADAWVARGGDQGNVVGGWAADHEVYVVTVRGKFQMLFTGRGTDEQPGGYMTVTERTYEIDATDGTIGLSGGDALPPSTLGMKSVGNLSMRGH